MSRLNDRTGTARNLSPVKQCATHTAPCVSQVARATPRAYTHHTPRPERAGDVLRALYRIRQAARREVPRRPRKDCTGDENGAAWRATGTVGAKSNPFDREAMIGRRKDHQSDRRARATAFANVDDTVHNTDPWTRTQRHGQGNRSGSSESFRLSPDHRRGVADAQQTRPESDSRAQHSPSGTRRGVTPHETRQHRTQRIFLGSRNNRFDPGPPLLPRPSTPPPGSTLPRASARGTRDAPAVAITPDRH